VNHLFLHCRPGFEKECAAEITELAEALGIYGYVKTKDASAYVLFISHEPDGALTLIRKLDFQQLIFARQWFATHGITEGMDVTDRLTPLMAAVNSLPKVSELMLETVDTNDGKEFSTLTKKFSVPFTRALEKQKWMQYKSTWRLHLVFITGADAFVGVSPIPNSSRWPMGIPRLRLPKEAPSRATLKLEEAWHHFIPAEEWDTRLASGMRAVDLGAAPGGWTWQLVQRGMYVEAVDNGAMDKALLESGQVLQMLSDGFVYEPKKPAHWLVCDIVDKPAKVASMVTRWFAKGDCKQAIFNLKLPMKQRYDEVKKIRERMINELEKLGYKVELEFKQLYHDREEVTGYLRVS
jgi:23S rRNA (cytidine2498-2'-O)-methyltransferase